jgi:stage II sporulation protein M
MSEIRTLLLDSKKYLLFAFLTFVIGMGLGFYYSHLFDPIIKQMQGQLEEIVGELKGKSALYIAFFIFLNNTRAAMMMLVLGTFFFLMPLVLLFVNGLVVGYVLNLSALNGGSPIEIFIFGLLPHGILELAAIFVAGGVGTFLGIRVLKWFFWPGGLFSHMYGKQRGELKEFWEKRGAIRIKKRFQQVLSVAFAVTFTLLLAALVESFITPILINEFITIPSIGK